MTVLSRSSVSRSFISFYVILLLFPCFTIVSIHAVCGHSLLLLPSLMPVVSRSSINSFIFLSVILLFYPCFVNISITVVLGRLYFFFRLFVPINYFLGSFSLTFNSGVRTISLRLFVSISF